MTYGWDVRINRASPICRALTWWKHAAYSDPGCMYTAGIPFTLLLSAPVIKVISPCQWMLVCLSFCTSDVHTYIYTHTAFIPPHSLPNKRSICGCFGIVRNILRWREPAFSSGDCSLWVVKSFSLVSWQEQEPPLRKVTVKHCSWHKKLLSTCKWRAMLRLFALCCKWQAYLQVAVLDSFLWI